MTVASATVIFQSVKEPPNRQNDVLQMRQRKAFSLGRRWRGEAVTDVGKLLATQDILTYCTTRSLPYHLYADGSELFVFGASLTAAGMSKRDFLTYRKKQAFIGSLFLLRVTKISQLRYLIFIGGML